MKTVLIADDERSLRLLVSATLASDDYQIVEAADGDQAWELLLRYRPQVVILDVMMPGQSGLDLARAIKLSADLKATKIVMLTAKTQEADIQAGLAAGADLYLTKPFSPLELLSVVEQALSLR